MRTDLAHALRSLRESRGLTQAQVAKHLELTRPAISKLEVGKSTTTVDVLDRWAALFQRRVVLVREQPDLVEDLSTLNPHHLDLVRKLVVLLPRLDPANIVSLWALVEAWEKSNSSADSQLQTQERARA